MDENASTTAPENVSSLRKAAPEQSKTAVCVLVLGMHRSGTSALTRVLNLLGVDLGGDLMPATADNEKGYWEHRGVVRIDAAILDSLDREWNDFSPMPRGWETAGDVPNLLERLASLLRSEFAGKQLFGVKDPRLCELLAGWRPLLRSLEADARCVLAFRNPVDVARSIARRDGISESRALAVWLRHTLDAEAESRGLRRTFVSYEALLQDWERVARKIAEDLGIVWPRPFDAVRKEIEDFLDVSLRHQARDDSIEAANVNPLVREAWLALRSSDWKDSPGLRTAFDRIGAEFDESKGISGELLGAVEREIHRQWKSLERKLRAKNREIADELDQVRRRGNKAATQLERAQAALQEARAEADLAESRKSKSELERERFLRKEAQASAERAERKAAQAERILAALRERLEASSAERSAQATGPRLSVPGRSAAKESPRDPFARMATFFDAEWYRNRYEEVAQSSLEPLAYYLALGWRQGHRPSAVFDPAFYRRSDRSSAGVCPLIHYVNEGSKNGAVPQALFDSEHYRSQFAEFEQPQGDLFEHYLTTGWKAGLSLHPLFDLRHYLRQAPDSAGTCPLRHYLEVGAERGLSPNPLFHPEFYVGQIPPDEPIDAAPFEHYVSVGWRDELQPHPFFRPTVAKGRQERIAQYLADPDFGDRKAHRLFNANYYRAQCASVGRTPSAPLLIDYLQDGWRQGASPHPLFSLEHYCSQTSQPLDAGIDPVSHYLMSGDALRLDPHPWFDVRFYHDAYGDRIPEGVTALEHFVENGDSGDFDPSAWFDAAYYLKANSRLGAIGNPLLHFVRSGLRDDASPTWRLNVEDYASLNGSVERSGMPPIQHWIERGRTSSARTISDRRLLREIGLLTETAADPAVRRFSTDELAQIREKLKSRRVVVLTNSSAGFAASEIAQSLASSLALVAENVLCVDCEGETDVLPEADVYFVPAPHEILAIGKGPRIARTIDWKRVVVLNSAAVQSPAYAKARPFLKRARLELAFDWPTAALTAAHERRATSFFPLSPLYDLRRPIELPQLAIGEGLAGRVRRYAPSIERPWAERPLDFAFAGSRTRRRERFFAQANATLATFEGFLHLPHPDRQPSLDSSEAVSPDDLSRFFASIGQRAKIVLNVHREEFPRFDWRRIVCGGIAQGALVVTEPSLPPPLFAAGTHYFSENARWMPELVRWLLEEEEGRRAAATVRQAAWDEYCRTFEPAQQGARLAAAVDRAIPLLG